MLILQGTLRAATVLGGGTNKKTGEIIPRTLSAPGRNHGQPRTGEDGYDHRSITGWIYRENRPAREHPPFAPGQLARR